MTDVAVTSPLLQEIEWGMGDWGSVPQCVRDTLLAIMSSSKVHAPREAAEQTERTLLPLRQKGPKTDISATLNALIEAQQPPAIFVPNLQSIVREPDRKLSRQEQKSNDGSAAPTRQSTDRFREYGVKNIIKSNNDNHGYDDDTNDHKIYEEEWRKTNRGGSRDWRVEEPHILPDRRVYYGVGSEVPSEKSRRDRPASSRCSGTVPQKKRPHAVRPVAMDAPTVNKGECLRHRREVTEALLRVHAEIDRLQEEADRSLVRAIYNAMRLDLRRAKDVYGEVKPLLHPTGEQEKALAAFAEGLAVLQEATVELVSAFLSQEEKWFLGINTHKYQTRTQRSTTYQYTTPSVSKSKEQTNVRSVDEDASSNSEDRRDYTSKKRETRPSHSESIIHGGGDAGTTTATPVPSLPITKYNDNVLEDTKPSTVSPTRKPLAATKRKPKKSPQQQQQQQQQQKPVSTVVGTNTASERGVVETKQTLNMLPQFVQFGCRQQPPQPKEPTATALTVSTVVPNQMGKGAPVPPSVPVRRQLSCSTLQTNSSDSQHEVMERKPAAAAAVPTNAAVKSVASVPAKATTAQVRPAVGLGKLDIKRFLIDSDSDSEA